MKKIFLIFITLLFTINSSKAVLSEDYTGLNLSTIVSPDEALPQLNNIVNFSFTNTQLSKIFLMLSTVGGFNIIFPDKYDKPITITIKEQKIKDAIYDICKLADLEYEFKGKSLVIFKTDFEGLDFAAIPVAYHKAPDMAKYINDELFNQLICNQNPNAVKPFAVEDPKKSQVVVFGNNEHINAARKLVDQIDLPPKVKIYSPKNIATKEILRIIQVFFKDNFFIEAKRIENDEILLKGNAKVVDEAIKLLESKDKQLPDVVLVAEVYSPKFTQDPSSEICRVIDTKLGHLQKNFFENQSPNILQFFDKKESLTIKLSNATLHELLGFNISVERNIIDQDKVSINVFNESLSAIIKQNSVYRIIDFDELKLNKELRKYLTSKKKRYLLINFVVIE